MTSKRWVLFDIGGVLEVVDDDAWQQEWWGRWQAASGLDRGVFDARIAAADLPAIDVTTGTEAAFWDAVSTALDLDAAQRSAMRADFWDAYCGTANGELIVYARTISSRAGTAILSNSADGAREEEERRFGFSEIFDPICYSHEQGVNKPEREAYLRALQRMGAKPGDVLFIDDHQVSVDGAEAVGIRAVRHVDNATTIAAIEAFLAD
ncbi:HAD-IA family hydrolase [Microbacterium oxydans]|uniref:HAD-IA family hydrolase n=1 Tax=Microbacterium oxydans TaxID=82380 RepID=UPI0024ADEF68|nr:HAD-IA family hydrolase [Microbacterium oxydans]